MFLKSLTVGRRVVVILLVTISTIGLVWVFANDRDAAGAEKLSALSTKTTVINGRYVPIPWDMSESTVKRIVAAVEGRNVVQITELGSRTQAYLAEQGLEPDQATTISGILAEMVEGPDGWRVRGEPRSQFSLSREDLLADDMRIWRAFRGFARQVATTNGVNFSRSDGVFFIPGESFMLNSGGLELRYFRAFFNSTPGRLRNPSRYATVTIDGIRGVTSGDP